MSNKNYAIFEKAFMLYSDGKTDDAIKKIMPAAEDGFGEAEEFLGSLFELKGQYTEAEKWYKRAIEHGRDPAKNALSNLYDVMESKGMIKKASDTPFQMTTNRYVDFEYPAFDKRRGLPKDYESLEKMFLGYMKAFAPNWKEGIYTRYQGSSSEEGQIDRDDFLRLSLAFLTHPDNKGYAYEKLTLSIYLRSINYNNEPYKSRKDKYLEAEKSLRSKGLCGLVYKAPTVTAASSLIMQQLAKELMFKSTDNSWYFDVLETLFNRLAIEIVGFRPPVAHVVNQLFDVPLSLLLREKIITEEDLKKPFFKDLPQITFADVLKYLDMPVYEVFRKLGSADPYTLTVNTVLDSASDDDSLFIRRTSDLPCPHLLHFPPEPKEKDYTNFKNTKGQLVENYYEVICSFSRIRKLMSEHGHLFFTCCLCELGEIDAAYVPDEYFERRTQQYAEYMTRLNYPQKVVDEYLARGSKYGTRGDI